MTPLNCREWLLVQLMLWLLLYLAIMYIDFVHHSTVVILLGSLQVRRAMMAQDISKCKSYLRETVSFIFTVIAEHFLRKFNYKCDT